MKKNCMKLYRAAVVVVAFLSVAVANAAFAAKTPDAKGIFDAISTQTDQAFSSIKPIVMKMIGIAGAVYGAINLFKYFKGDRESSQELIKGFVGIAIAVVFETIVYLVF